MGLLLLLLLHGGGDDVLGWPSSSDGPSVTPTSRDGGG